LGIVAYGLAFLLDIAISAFVFYLKIFGNYSQNIAGELLGGCCLLGILLLLGYWREFFVELLGGVVCCEMFCYWSIGGSFCGVD
jgi:hypothetical protein